MVCPRLDDVQGRARVAYDSVAANGWHTSAGKSGLGVSEGDDAVSTVCSVQGSERRKGPGRIKGASCDMKEDPKRKLVHRPQ